MLFKFPKVPFYRNDSKLSAWGVAVGYLTLPNRGRNHCDSSRLGGGGGSILMILWDF